MCLYWLHRGVIVPIGEADSIISPDWNKGGQLASPVFWNLLQLMRWHVLPLLTMKALHVIAQEELGKT